MPDLISKIESAYAQLTPAARKVANYLQLYYGQAQYLSITELAQECSVAEATVFRFCRTLGLSGYNELKLALAKQSLLTESNPYQAYSEISQEDTVEAMCRQLYNANMEALTQTLDLLNENALRQAVDILVKAGRVMCFGYGGSMPGKRDCFSRSVGEKQRQPALLRPRKRQYSFSHHHSSLSIAGSRRKLASSGRYHFKRICNLGRKKDFNQSKLGCMGQGFASGVSPGCHPIFLPGKRTGKKRRGFFLERVQKAEQFGACRCLGKSGKPDSGLLCPVP